MNLYICPYCQKEIQKVKSKDVYGYTGFGKIYICFPCNAYVGSHKNTEEPLGTVAKIGRRNARMRAHAAFDPLWKNGGMTRFEAYKWLADKLDIKLKNCHIGYFDEVLCNRVIQILKQHRRT